jgi:3-oxoacyl-[acyl-carrier protein] reductase
MLIFVKSIVVMETDALYPDLENKTVVVTGAGEGIGEAIAKSFIKQQAKVILVSRNNIKWINKGFNDCLFIKSDIRDISNLEYWLNEYEASGNTIDILVNNAGVISQQALLDATEEQWDDIIGVNSKATFFLTKIFARHMVKNRCGNIIFSSSFSTKLPSYSYGLYAASKSLILSITKSYAAELAPYNIRVNSYSPGVVKTKMTKSAIDNNKNNMLHDISLNRFGGAHEVAKGVLFLASNSSSYITGIDLDISGGKLIIQNPNFAYDRV